MVLNKIFGKKNSDSDIDTLKERFSQMSSSESASSNDPSLNESQSTKRSPLEVQDALASMPQQTARVSPSLDSQNNISVGSQAVQQLISQEVSTNSSVQQKSFLNQKPLNVSQEAVSLSSTELNSQKAQVVASTISSQKNDSINLPSWAIESAGEESIAPVVDSQTPSTSNKVTQSIEEIEDKYYDAKLNSLIIDQVKELIEIDNNLNNKIEDLSSEFKKEILEREKLSKKVDQHFDKVNELERSMEKFLGLYEMVTNQFNPFVDKGDKDLFLDDVDKKYPNPVVENPIKNIQAPANTTPNNSLFSEPVSSPSIPVVNSQPIISPVKKSSQSWSSAPLHPAINSSLHFELKDGQKLSSIYDVLAVLEQMTEETFTHHVSLKHNDFSNWIYRVLGLTDLGQQLDMIKTRPEMIRCIRSYIQTNMINSSK